MSVPEEDDSKSDTTQNLFKHSPVPPPTPPLSPSSNSALLGCFYAGWLSIRNRAAEKLSTVPTLSHAGSQSQDTWPSVRPSARTPPSRSGAGRRPIGAGIAVRKDGGWRGAAEERTALLFLLLHFAHMRGRGGRGKGKQCGERASELSTMLGAVLSALGWVHT